MPPFVPGFGLPSIADPEQFTRQERTAKLRDGSTITIPAGTGQDETLNLIYQAELKKGLLPNHRLSPELAKAWGLDPSFELPPQYAEKIGSIPGMTPAIGPGGVVTWGYTTVRPPTPDVLGDSFVNAIMNPLKQFTGSFEKLFTDPGSMNFGDFASVATGPAGATVVSDVEHPEDIPAQLQLATIAVNPANAFASIGQGAAREGVGELLQETGTDPRWLQASTPLLSQLLGSENETPPTPPTRPTPEKDMGLIDTLFGRGAPPPALGNNVGVPFLPPIPGIGQQGQGDPFRTPGTVGKDVDIFDLNRLSLPENIGDILNFKKMPDLGGLDVTLPKEFGLDLLRGLGLGGIGDDLGFWGGGVRLPPTEPAQSQSWLDKLVGSIKGLPSVIAGGRGGLGGLLGGARQQFGGTNDLGSNLGLMAGLGLLGAGLAQQRETPDMESLFYGAPKQAQELFAGQQAAETARRQAAEDQYLGRRTEARRSLEDVLGQDTERAISRGVQTQQEKLNRQGLLGGPSGAMNEAVARVSGDVRQSQLPSLVDFLGQTETGLQGLRGGALTGDISLGRAGVERQSTLQDQQREATLRQRLLAAENKNRQRSELLRTGSELTGYGLGGSGGGQVGSAIGRSLESILG